VAKEQGRHPAAVRTGRAGLVRKKILKAALGRSSVTAVYEQEGTVVARFDKASSTERLRFIDGYLWEGEQKLMEMLPAD
jgi:hypothetical protein